MRAEASQKAALDDLEPSTPKRTWAEAEGARRVVRGDPKDSQRVLGTG